MRSTDADGVLPEPSVHSDLGTEGAQDADVHVRDAVNRGLIPGPRIFCATECLASSGGYEIRQENTIGGTATPRISDPCDSIAGVRAGMPSERKTLLSMLARETSSTCTSSGSHLIWMLGTLGHAIGGVLGT